MNRVVIMGAGGRDFHNFNVAFRDDPETTVVAFTATQIPGIANRVYPPSLAGERYPDGIPIRPEDELSRLVREQQIDEAHARIMADRVMLDQLMDVVKQNTQAMTRLTEFAAHHKQGEQS